MSSRARILIADDHQVLRQGVCALLSGDGRWSVCGEAQDGQEAVAKVAELNPDLVVLDVTMPVMNGLEAAREIRKLAPATKIVIFSMHDSPAMKTEFLKIGADAFVLKSQAANELTATIARLLQSTAVK